MYNFDEMHQKIYSSNTKQYFAEVLSSFYNGNYRSAIVMLYSVVITDIMFKLDELKNIYNEQFAQDIVEEINKSRQQNPTSAEWENYLINKIGDYPSFIDKKTLEDIKYLRTLRHLSAHPALNQVNELYLPNRFVVAGCIESMLTDVLSIPPFYTKKITDTIVNDISSNRARLIKDYNVYKKYLCNVYLKNMPKSMYVRVFRDIWKLTFRLENSDCDINRNVNARCLRIMYSEQRDEVLDDIRKNRTFYSNISNKDNVVIHVVVLLGFYPEIYSFLADNFKSTLDVCAVSNKQIQIASFFIKQSMQEHIENLKTINYEKNMYNAYAYLTRRAIETKDAINEILIHNILKLKSCNSPDLFVEVLNYLINPFLGSFTEGNYSELFETIENHEGVSLNNNAIRNAIEQTVDKATLPSSFDITKFPRVYSAINEDEYEYTDEYWPENSQNDFDFDNNDESDVREDSDNNQQHGES